MWRFFGFSGRIGRQTWWLAHLLVAALTFLAWDDLVFSLDRRGDTEPTAYGLAALAAVLWISWSANVQRLHDHNKPATMSNLSFRWAHDLLIELGFRKGDEGPNDFGPPEPPFLRPGSRKARPQGAGRSGAGSPPDGTAMHGAGLSAAPPAAERPASTARARSNCPVTS